MTEAQLKQDIIDQALALGFDQCRIAAAHEVDGAGAGLAAFVAAGHHGQMDWMKSRMEARSAPRKLWPAAQSVIMLGLNYGPGPAAHDDDPLAYLAAQDRGAISVYAQRRDYHDVVKKKLKALARWLVNETEAEVKVFVDTAPVMEKPLAQQAGLGWQGKHTNLVSRELGSWLFLGSVFTTLALVPDAPETDHCGSCSACLDICPTAAFPAPYQLDARRCISYLTIEHKGMIDAALRPLMGNHIYGCDDCLAVCPWNKYAADAHDAKLALNADYALPDLVFLSGLDEAGFRDYFRQTPIKRTGRDHFIRNVLIALGNMGSHIATPNQTPKAAHVEAVTARLDDAAPVVRGTAVWALGRLDPEAAKRLAPRYVMHETDTDVLSEWQQVEDAKGELA